MFYSYKERERTQNFITQGLRERERGGGGERESEACRIFASIFAY